MIPKKDQVRFTPSPCPQCGDGHGVVRSATTTVRATSETPSGMNIRVECPACHHTWLQPMPPAATRDSLTW